MSAKDILRLELKQAFLELFSRHTGISIRQQEEQIFFEGILARLKALGLNSPESYYQILNYQNYYSDVEWQHLILLITNNETFFFRDRQQFALLRDRLLPEILQCQQNFKSLRILSAGCSTGEEAYSLAILLRELVGDYSNWDFLILGVDIDPQAISKAKQAIYNSWSFRQVSQEIKNQYFKFNRQQYFLKDEIKKMVRFQQLNLVADPFPQVNSQLRDFDLIICRNVFIYMSGTAISTIIDKFYHSLKDGGYLLTGHSELYKQNLDKFTVKVFDESIAYQKNLSTPNIDLSLSNSYSLDEVIAAKDSSLVSEEFNNLSLVAPLSPLEPINNEDRQSLDRDLLQKAQDNLDRGQKQTALVYLNSLLDINNNPHACILMARIRFELGELELANFYARRSLQLETLVVDPYCLLAQITESGGNLVEAKALYKKIITMEPNWPIAYWRLNKIYACEGDNYNSQKMVRAALDLLNLMPGDVTIPFSKNLTAWELLKEINSTLTSI